MTTPIAYHLIGHVGVGKSTVAGYLDQKYNCIQVNGDVIWKGLYNPPNYDDKTESAHVYREAEKIIRKEIGNGNDIVLEVFGMNNESRSFAKKIVHESGGAYQQIEVTSSDESTLKKRIENRFNDENRDSDGDWNVYLKLKNIRKESDNDNRITLQNNGNKKQLFEIIDSTLMDF